MQRRFMLLGRRAPSLIRSIQRGTITIAAASTGTASITAVDVTSARLKFLGVSDSTSETQEKFLARLTLTNATTVTATVGGTPTSINVSYEVVEYWPGVVRSIQTGTITLNTVASATATINTVDVNQAEVDYLGMTQTAPTNSSLAFERLLLTNATTVTGFSGSGGGNNIVGFQVTEFN